MQENSALIENIKKYLETRKKIEPTRLDSFLRAYVKGEVQSFFDKFPFLTGESVNFPQLNIYAQPENNEYLYKKKINVENDCAFFAVRFEKSGYFGEIIFFDEYYKYFILNDALSETEDIVETSDYNEEGNSYKSVIEEVWNTVCDAVKKEDSETNGKLKKKKRIYKMLYYICYVLACLVAIAIILLNHSSDSQISLWFLLIAIVPAIVGSYFKYKTLDKK